MPGACARVPEPLVAHLRRKCLLQAAAEPCGLGLMPPAAKPLPLGIGRRTVGSGHRRERVLGVGR